MSSSLANENSKGWMYKKGLVTKVLNENGRIHAIVCAKCGKTYKSASTGNMIRHLANTHGITEQGKASSALDQFLQIGGQPASVTITRDAWREQLARFLIASKSSYSLVENTEFRNLIQYTQAVSSPGIVASITDNTAKSDIHTLFLREQAQIISYLQAQESLSFTVDLWTSPWGKDFLGITAHFIDDT